MKLGRSIRSWKSACLLSLAFIVGAVPSASQSQQLVLGLDGTVYELHEGLYGELFPEGEDAAKDSPVLALDIIRADGATERQLIPGTASADPEGSSSIVFEKAFGIYVLWETWFNGLHPILNLTSFDGAEWSEVIEIASGPFALKGSPKLIVTREKGQEDSFGDLTTLHLTWWQEAAGDVSQKQYAPVFIEGGQYKGWAPVIDLGAFLPHEDDPVLSKVEGLENAICIRPGKDDHSVVVGFLNPRTHRLGTVELEILPQELANLADKVRAQIIIFGTSAKTHTELAVSAADQVMELGSSFYSAALAHMANQVQDLVENSTTELTESGVASIADKVRAQLIIFGTRFGNGGLAEADESQIIEVGHPASSEGPYQYVKVTPISDRVAPEIGGTAELFISRSGQSVIVAWEDEKAVYYRESQEEGWSEVSAIELNEQLDRDSVRAMLEDYVLAE